MQVTDKDITKADANSGVEIRNAINAVFRAINTQNSGNSEPLNPEPFMPWVDTSNETTHYLKFRNHANDGWFIMFEYDVATKSIKLGEFYTKAEITTLLTQLKSEIVGGSPALLDTLIELSTALGNDANFATTVLEALAEKAPQSTTYTIDQVNALLSNISGGGVRQTVQYASVDTTTGQANFISAGTGLSVNVSATTNIKINAAGGDVDRVGKILSNTTISALSANATNYLYADIALDGSVTLGSTTLAPLYQFGGTPSTTNGQFTFNIGEMSGYVGNESLASKVWRVFLAEAITNTSAVTSVVNYALNGLYKSAPVAFSGAVVLNFNHNIGDKVENLIPVAFGKASNDTYFSANPTGYAGGVIYPIFSNNTATTKSISVVTQSGGILIGGGATTTGFISITVKRGW